MFVRSDSLGGVLVSDLEYPQRVVFTLLNKVSIKITKYALLTIFIWNDTITVGCQLLNQT